MQAGFDMDLYLDWRRDGHPNGYNLLLRNTDTPMEHEGDSSYFNADSGASIASFLTEYLPDELSSDADVLLSLGEPAVSGGQLTLSRNRSSCLVKPVRPHLRRRGCRQSRLGIVNRPSRQTPTPLASSNSPNVLQSLSI